MKKIFIFTFICLSLCLVTGCGEKNVEGSLDELMASVYSDVYEGVADDQKPMLGTINVLQDAPDNIEYYIGTKEIEYEEIFVSEPMMGSIPHSVVLVRMKDGADINAAKTKIKDTVNPRKWVCVGVEAEDVIVKSKGDLIILIMVKDEKAREKIEKGFDNL